MVFYLALFLVGVVAGAFLGLILGARLARAEVVEARRLHADLTDQLAERGSEVAPVGGPAPPHAEGR